MAVTIKESDLKAIAKAVHDNPLNQGAESSALELVNMLLQRIGAALFGPNVSLLPSDVAARVVALGSSYFDSLLQCAQQGSAHSFPKTTIKRMIRSTSLAEPKNVPDATVDITAKMMYCAADKIMTNAALVTVNGSQSAGVKGGRAKLMAEDIAASIADPNNSNHALNALLSGAGKNCVIKIGRKKKSKSRSRRPSKKCKEVSPYIKGYVRKDGVRVKGHCVKGEKKSKSRK